MYGITVTEHPHYRVPYLGYRGTPFGIDVGKVAASGVAPVVNAGLASKEAGRGTGGGQPGAPAPGLLRGAQGVRASDSAVAEPASTERGLHPRAPRVGAARPPLAHGRELGGLPARRPRPGAAPARRGLRAGHDHPRPRRPGGAGPGARARHLGRGGRPGRGGPGRGRRGQRRVRHRRRLPPRARRRLLRRRPRPPGAPAPRRSGRRPHRDASGAAPGRGSWPCATPTTGPSSGDRPIPGSTGGSSSTTR